MSQGYSASPVYKKLGLKEETKLLVINAPGDYKQLIQTDPGDYICDENEQSDIVHVFVKSHQEFLDEMEKLKPKIHPKIAIWVSWYKKASKIKTDINEDIIRAYALENQLVDIKVCAINEIWSGLKLVVPVSKR